MWYFKGRRKKYKSPYTGKEVDAAVKKAEDTTATAEEINATVAKVDKLPNTTSADEGKIYAVDSEGNTTVIDIPSSVDVGGEEWAPNTGFGNLYYVEKEGVKYIIPSAYGENGIATSLAAISVDYDDEDLPIPSTFRVEDYSFPVNANFSADYYDEVDLVNSTYNQVTIAGITVSDSYDGTYKNWLNYPITEVKVSSAVFDSILGGTVIQNNLLALISGETMKHLGVFITDGTRCFKLNNAEGKGDSNGWVVKYNAVFADASNIYYIECTVNAQLGKWTFVTHSFS